METEMNDIYFETNRPGIQKDYGLGLFTVKRLVQLLKIIFSKKVCVIFVILICLMSLLEQFLIYHVGMIPSKFYTVLGDKNWRAFWLQVLKSTLLIFALCSVLGCKKYITNVYYVSSREILTKKLHAMYFSCNKFYFLNTFKYALADNPDQRITQDIDKFCNKFSSVINPFVIAPFTIAYYSYDCFITTGWIGPMCIFAVFLLSATVNRFMMKPIVSKVMLQEKYEGFFRFKHMHVRTNAESIALQDASYVEMSQADSKLSTLVKTQQSLYLREYPLNIAVNVFNYIGSIISYLILAYPIFNGKFDDLSPVELSTLISKNAFVSIYLISCFSSLINLSTTISEICGLTHRVSDLLDVLNLDIQIEDECYDNKLKLKFNQFSDDLGVNAFELRGVTICPPKEIKPLVLDLDLEISFGSNLLITGKSSSGKTSVFRVIRGLWPVYCGHIIRRVPFLPSLVFFLPQHPLLSDGTLLDQIVYPMVAPKFVKLKDEDTEIILRYLKLVELDHILEKTGLNSDVDWNWCDVLSPGESQRLSFARLFYHRPKLAFLDEATSALGLEMEDKLYKTCKDLGITVVSIGHRESLQQFHDNILHLDCSGGWTLSPVPSISFL